MHKDIIVITFFYILVVYFFIHKHFLFYVTAFSATFKLLTTQMRFLATFLYQHVKERRAEKDLQR